MELVQRGDGTNPPHDDSGWWYEPFQDANGRWPCGSDRDDTSVPGLKPGQSNLTPVLLERRILIALLYPLTSRSEALKGPGTIGRRPKSERGSLGPVGHVADYVAGRGSASRVLVSIVADASTYGHCGRWRMAIKRVDLTDPRPARRGFTRRESSPRAMF